MSVGIEATEDIIEDSRPGSELVDVLLVEPFFTGSHAAWAHGLQKHSAHAVDLLTLSGAHWKWRMHGGAVTLARKFMAGDAAPDLIVATDMLDLTTFLALTRERTSTTPTAVYFHENQLTYPWSPKDRDLQRNRDKHYSFINYASALAADHVFFNSHYHRDSFLGELPAFLKQFPDNQELGTVDKLEAKSSVLPLGFDFSAFAAAKPADVKRSGPALVVWNHRWEYDKNPDLFYLALKMLKDHAVDFRVAVLGEEFDVVPDAFAKMKAALADRIVHFGFADSQEEYARWLWQADIVPVTSNQDFFGVSVMEALYCGCFPLLPRRLAFPELMPREMQSTCFYERDDDFGDRLAQIVQNIDRLRHLNFSDVTKQYEWEVMAPRYDDAFASVVDDRS